MTLDYAIAPFFPLNQPLGTPVQNHNKAVYNYSLTMLDEKTIRIYRQTVGSKENKEIVCESQLAGNFKATGIEKTYGDRFYFVLVNRDVIKRDGKWRQKAAENELYCYGLQEGLIDFICCKINKVAFSENYVALYDNDGRNNNEDNLTLYSLGSVVKLTGPYSFSSNRKYASILPLLSRRVYFPPCGSVSVDEQGKMVRIMAGDAIDKQISFS